MDDFLDEHFQNLQDRPMLKNKAKVMRFLASQGFDLATAGKAYINYFKNLKTTDNEGDYYDDEY